MLKTIEALKLQVKELVSFELSDNAASALITFFDMVIEQNKYTNLTRITEFDEFVNKNIVDSIMVIKKHDIKIGSTLTDAGTGFGVPGIILKIVRPDLKITLIDSNGKKTQFTNKVIRELKLEDITSQTNRTELIRPEYVDYVIARAMAPLNELVELTAHLIKVGGQLLFMKSDKVNEELNKLGTGYKYLGLDKPSVTDMSFLDMTRKLIVFDKIASTPRTFPRNYSQIVSNPLK